MGHCLRLENKALLDRSDNLCRIASVEDRQKNEQAETKRYIEPAEEQGTNELEWYIALSLLADALFSGIRWRREERRLFGLRATRNVARKGLQMMIKIDDR